MARKWIFIYTASFYIIVRKGFFMNFSIRGSSAWWLRARMVHVTALDIQVSLRNPLTNWNGMGISSVLLLVLNWLQFSIGLPYLLQSGILQNVMSIRFRPVCHRLPLPISRVCRVPSGMSQPFIISIFTSVGNNTSIRIQPTTRSWHKDFLFGTINVLQQKKKTMGGGTLSANNEVGGAPIVCTQWRAPLTLLSVSSFCRPWVTSPRQYSLL